MLYACGMPYEAVGDGVGYAVSTLHCSSQLIFDSPNHSLSMQPATVPTQAWVAPGVTHMERVGMGGPLSVGPLSASVGANL